MTLRWLKGNWEFGKWKLQYRLEGIPGKIGSSTPWFDVPIAESKKKSTEELREMYNDHIGEKDAMVCNTKVGVGEWCKEIVLMPYGYYFKGSSLGCHVPEDWTQCPVCLTPRPQPKPLRERLAEKLKHWIEINGHNPSNHTAGDVADRVLKFLEENK